MTPRPPYAVFVLFCLFILIAGCSTEPPLKKPGVTVTDIALSDVSLRTMTVNATVNIHNPNPVGATLSRVAFDVWYDDDGRHYLGHGEQAGIAVRENGNTTTVIPVKIGTLPAVQAAGSLVKNGAITIRVNGTASVDLKVVQYDVPFEETRSFEAGEFAGLVPDVSLAGTSVNVPEKLEQARDLLSAFTG